MVQLASFWMHLETQDLRDLQYLCQNIASPALLWAAFICSLCHCPFALNSLARALLPERYACLAWFTHKKQGDTVGFLPCSLIEARKSKEKDTQNSETSSLAHSTLSKLFHRWAWGVCEVVLWITQDLHDHTSSATQMCLCRKQTWEDKTTTQI